VNTAIAFDQVSFANAINNNGQVVGTTDLEPPLNFSLPEHAFIYNYSGNTTVYLDIANSGRESDGLAINSGETSRGSFPLGRAPEVSLFPPPVWHRFTPLFTRDPAWWISAPSVGPTVKAQALTI
jgi:hypothetical protein